MKFPAGIGAFYETPRPVTIQNGDSGERASDRDPATNATVSMICVNNLCAAPRIRKLPAGRVLGGVIPDKCR